MTIDKIFFRSRDKLVQIEPSKIVYFEADGNYTRIVMVNKLHSLICMNLGDMEKVRLSGFTRLVKLELIKNKV